MRDFRLEILLQSLNFRHCSPNFLHTCLEYFWLLVNPQIEDEYEREWASHAE